ncbi:protein-L-isoaspartate(D-aspartate) O-methyltransferase [Rubrivirga sp. S365]|uniref:Protein-L-isoaspartate O-methyltransferase n=1 Tax=Rubrivirga litoralis TaxID=3075598 RepID=A0ABU3BTC7_9BACT|nr:MULTISPECIES: protein-L-isoaspartate(D-aspartate) O-methyltransferase [unclassified Rubrivirga]MDT0632421.1 protein-L-isoaspartate(D-aspartate) O-methyltransferase [Rubrivirga sp. F394]MDT7855208.1 protein-L-isoaspartate(D-aspartate) O-methyltransferase [Rubrivirga sp. S365]
MPLTDRVAARRRADLVAALRAKGIADERVLAAVGSVPRHLFIPDSSLLTQAYDDVALPIGLGQTISQPFTVARMTELLAVREGDRVLEVGTGSGYQAAVLAALGARVFSVERHAPILSRTDQTLGRLGIRVRTRTGDGTRGWPAYAPFDAIVVTAGGPAVPPDLVAQLRDPAPPRPDARLVIPVGPPDHQVLHRITRVGPDETRDETFDGVVFVPLVSGEG